MSLQVETVTIQRMSLTRDAAGGATQVPVTVWTGSGYRNFYRRQSELRLEEGTHNSEGPGISVDTHQFYTFEAAVPSVMPRDTIISPDGTSWLVLFVRDYSDAFAINVQVDVEFIA